MQKKSKKIKLLQLPFLISLSLFLNSATTFAKTKKLTSYKPLIIGHRGACGHTPEHTLKSYQLAIDMKADYIEPDLVMTKDKVLIARHENEISETTDVAEKFPDRKTTKKIDGKSVTGWFTEDFSLAEIKTLRAKERLPFRNHSEDLKYEVPTFSEILDLVQTQSKKNKRKIGVYPEVKHPSYFKSIGLPLEKALIEELKKHKMNTMKSPVIIQSFELSSLKELKKMTDHPLIFLIDDPQEIPFDHVLANDKRTYLDLMTPTELKKIKEVAYGIGPHKNYLIPEGKDRKLLPPTPLLKMAHDIGLKVHIYTFRNEEKYLNPEYNNNPENEYHRFFELDVDGLFSDFPDTAVKALESYNKDKK